MALQISPGATGILLGVPMTKRDDISELLLPSMAQQNNLTGAIPVGEDFRDNVCRWDEDNLNPGFITDTTSGGQNNTDTVSNLNISAADAGLTRVGWILSDKSAAAGGLGAGEQVRVLAETGTVVQVARAVNGTTETTHAQGAQWAVVNPAELEVSNLNADQSRPRQPFFNYVSRHSRDVIVSTEQQMRSNTGAAVGVPNEIKYDLEQRLAELAQQMSVANLYSRPYAGRNGNSTAPSVAAGDYSTHAGVHAFLDGSFISGTVVKDWVTDLGLGVGQVEPALNAANVFVDGQGGLLDWVAIGSLGAQDIGRIQSDRIRLRQDDMTRGYAINVFLTLLGNSLDVLRDSHIEDQTGIGQLYFLDSSRLRARMMAEAGCRLLTAPTLLDAGVARVITKYSLEVRNVSPVSAGGTGQAHILVKNANFTQN